MSERSDNISANAGRLMAASKVDYVDREGDTNCAFLLDCEEAVAKATLIEDAVEAAEREHRGIKPKEASDARD